ncbi:reverse transcriptase [Tanacetum coccineum]
MKKMVKETIRTCDVCQRNKAGLSSYPCLLKPLPIPSQVWKDISMDIIDSLPISQGKTSILVVVDRLSKYAHFIALTHPYSVKSIAQCSWIISTDYMDCLHSFTIKITAFEIMYGQAPSLYIPYVAKDNRVELVDRTLQVREVAISMLKFNLKKSQDRMKSQADKHMFDREFTIGMTQNSNTKIFTPFANPERQFRARLDTTPISVHNIYSFYESEPSDVEFTMEQYFALNHGDTRRGVRKPEIEGNMDFEIKGQFLREMRDNTFSGNANEDAHEHVGKILEIASLFNTPRVSGDTIMLRVFPLTL